jgi:hypothetical protein
MAAFFASLPDTTEEHRHLVVRYLERNCAESCFLPGVGFGGTMQIKPSFQKSISMNVARWKIHRAEVHWLKIFKTTEEFDAWRTAPATVPEASLPEATSDNALLEEAIVDDMSTVLMASLQLNPFDSTALVGYYSPAVEELVKCLHLGGVMALFGTPSHAVPTRTALVRTTKQMKEPQTSDVFVQTLGGQPYKATPKQVELTMDDPFNEDDDWDSGVEMDKCLNGQGGYDHMTKSDRTVAMQLNSQRSRRATDIEHKKQTTREAIDRMEMAVQRVECKSSLTYRLAPAIDLAEAECAIQALKQCDVSRIRLVIGCERVAAIARRAGVHPSTPVVRSVVDTAFIFLCTGLDNQEAVATWHCMVAQVLLTFLRERAEKENESMYNLNKISTLWTVSELLTAREVARERRRRCADRVADSRKRQK